MFGITAERVSQAIVGELSVDEAVDRMASDLRGPRWPTRK